MTTTCIVEACPHESDPGRKGMCLAHYARVRKYGSPRTDIPLMRRKGAPIGPCAIDGCRHRARATGICATHYTRRWKYGAVDHGRPIRYQDNRRKAGSGGFDRHGYHRVFVNGRKSPEHRVVMERVLGRPLLPTENVHHKNGDRADNRPENLEMWSTSQPSGQRVPEKVAWAKELLSFYEPEPEWIGAGC